MKLFCLLALFPLISLYGMQEFRSRETSLNEKGEIELSDLCFSLDHAKLQAQKARLSIHDKDRVYGENILLATHEISIISPECFVHRQSQTILCSQTAVDKLVFEARTPFGTLKGSMDGACLHKSDQELMLDLLGPILIDSPGEPSQIHAGGGWIEWDAQRKLKSVRLTSESKSRPLIFSTWSQNHHIILTADDVYYHSDTKSIRVDSKVSLTLTTGEACQGPSPAQNHPSNAQKKQRTKSIPNTKWIDTLITEDMTEANIELPDKQMLCFQAPAGLILEHGKLQSKEVIDGQVALHHENLHLTADRLLYTFPENQLIELQGAVKAVFQKEATLYGMICDRVLYDPIAKTLHMTAEADREVMLWDYAENLALRFSDVTLNSEGFSAQGAVNLYLKQDHFKEALAQTKGVFNDIAQRAKSEKND